MPQEAKLKASEKALRTQIARLAAVPETDQKVKRATMPTVTSSWSRMMA